MTAFVVACFIGGRSLIINQESAPLTIVAAKEVSTAEHQAKRPVTAMMLVTNNKVITPVDSTVVDSAAIAKKPKSKMSRPGILSARSNIKSGSDATLVEPIAIIAKKEETSVSIAEVTPDEAEIKKVETDKKDFVQQTTSINSEVRQEEKKKGLFKKIFGKKKKED